jgi:outer membrane protein OmpA-like peptidoglycan-associated protein
LDLAVAYVVTGGLNRLGLEAGVGYEMSLVDGLQLGPFLRYVHIFQTEGELDEHDAMILIVGVSFSAAIPSHAHTERLLDPDGDGIFEPEDQCPEEAEDFDGVEDDDGCPEHEPPGPSDRDGDGLFDDDDLCPEEPEDRDGFEDDDGCPDLDHDHDGIEDENDLCPTEAEVVNGVDDDDGCPDIADIEVINRDILLRDRVYFDFALARIRGRSVPLLEQIVRLLAAHPEYVTISIEGHCDDVGSDEVNQRLSELRAQRVVSFLAAQGTSVERLESVGYGRRRPTHPGTSDSARQQNRRVEFRITGIDAELQHGRALPRTDPAAVPHLGPGGAILEPTSQREDER